MHVEQLPLSGALLLTPKVFNDDRGSFEELFATERYAAAGITETFVQDNLSVSRRNVLRGLHGDPRMSKLVRVVSGEAFDVIVDARPGSPTRLRWYGTLLRAAEHRQIYVPTGFFHGFLALSETVVFLYKQSALYDPSTERGAAWNDPSLAIDWPLGGAVPVLSAKDAANPPVADLGSA
jgi:dTDP-4-dehydrorhamnose 3,5-epimerase